MVLPMMLLPFIITTHTTFVSTVAHITVTKTDHASHHPFVITYFTNHEKKDQFHDGYEISMLTDPREVKPDPEFTAIYKHEAYLIDSHTVMVIVPVFPYSYLRDSLVARSYAKDQKIDPCDEADDRREEVYNVMSKAGQSTIQTHRRYLLHFPEEEPLNNNVYGGEEHADELKPFGYIVINQHRFGRDTINVPVGRMVWRTTISSAMGCRTKIKVAKEEEPSLLGMMDRARIHAVNEHGPTASTYHVEPSMFAVATVFLCSYTHSCSCCSSW